MKENSDTDQEEEDDSQGEDSESIIDLEKDDDEGETMNLHKTKKNSLRKSETSNSSASEEILRMLSFHAF